MERKILLLADEKRAPYHPVSRVARGIEQALSDVGRLEICTEHRGMDVGRLRQYDAVISYLDTYKELDGLDDVLADHIGTGGKILALHNGIITERGSRLEAAYGGNFITHPPGGDLLFESGSWLGEERFMLTEEPYMVSMYDTGNRVFLTFEYEGEKYPAGWCRRWKKGSMIYLSPGHDERTAGDTKFQEILKKCIRKLQLGT